VRSVVGAVASNRGQRVCKVVCRCFAHCDLDLSVRYSAVWSTFSHSALWYCPQWVCPTRPHRACEIPTIFARPKTPILVRVAANACYALQGYCTLVANTLAGLLVVVVVDAVLVQGLTQNVLSVFAFTYLSKFQRFHEEPLQEVHRRDEPQQLRRNAHRLR
jgi:hypothetical protein